LAGIGRKGVLLFVLFSLLLTTATAQEKSGIPVENDAALPLVFK